MSQLDLLVALSAALAGLMLLVGNHRHAGWASTAGYTVLLGLLLALEPGGNAASSEFTTSVLGQRIFWQLDGLGWFFALITLAAALLSAWYSAGPWRESYLASGRSPRILYTALALNVFAMLALLASGEWISLFIGWELVSWASYLLMTLAGGVAAKAAMRYITYAFAGAMAVLMGLVLLYTAAGSLEFPAMIRAMDGMQPARLWLVVLLFLAGFGVKMGLMPLHLWQARAYALTPGPGAAFLGAISSRMGLFAIMLVLVKLVTLARLENLYVVLPALNARELMLWIAAITVILPTFTALKQNDARMLLAWHGIGQGGYMLMGVAMGDAMGSAGGLMHVFNHATYQAALFMVVFAVMQRTGTADLNRLGGLVTRMPLSFLAMLVGIIGLAGLPPMNGFVSKWLVYRALIAQGEPLLFVAAVIGTLGTILSVYKLIHNMFLGQLRVEHTEVREASASMLWPMMLLSAIVFVTGVFPGLVLHWVAAAQAAAGLPVLEFSIGGVESARGSLLMPWVVGVLFAGFGVAAVLFYSAARAKRVHPLDNYAGGHFLSADVRYQYSDNFYAGLMHLVGGWYRGSFQWAEEAITSLVRICATGSSGFFRRAQPVVYLVVATVLGAYWVIA